MRVCWWWLLVGVAACHTAPLGMDAGGGSNGPSGLVIPWSTTPATIPGSADDDGSITITSAAFTVETLEAIGDASTGSGNKISLALAWGSDGSAPQPTTLPAAPPGLYSKLSLKVDGSLIGDSYEIAGTATVDGSATPYTIHDSDELSISIDVYGTLDPGKTLTIPVAIDLARALRTIDFSSVDDDGGMLTLTTDDPQMDSFRDQLRDSFYEPDDDGGSGSGSGSDLP
jgi:hypothetical protein